MLEQQQTAMAYAEAKNRRDINAAVAHWASDGFFEAVPLGLRVEGREAVRDCFAAFLDAFPNYCGVVEGGAFESETAAAWWRLTGTMDYAFLGLAPTGRSVEVA